MLFAEVEDEAVVLPAPVKAPKKAPKEKAPKKEAPKKEAPAAIVVPVEPELEKLETPLEPVELEFDPEPSKEPENDNN